LLSILDFNLFNNTCFKFKFTSNISAYVIGECKSVVIFYVHIWPVDIVNIFLTGVNINLWLKNVIYAWSLVKSWSTLGQFKWIVRLRLALAIVCLYYWNTWKSKKLPDFKKDSKCPISKHVSILRRILWSCFNMFVLTAMISESNIWAWSDSQMYSCVWFLSDFDISIKTVM
jgi:hypothetical protein